MARYVDMPRLSQDMTRGRIVAWLKKEGAPVQEGEALLSVETDKAEMELESPASGILRRVLVEAGQDADVGAPLAILGAADEDIQPLLARSPGPGTSAARPATAQAPPPVSRPTGQPVTLGKRVPVSPVARRIARELGVDLAEVAGTGAGGLITEQDVRAAAEGKSAPETGTVIPLTGLRRRIAERLSASRHTAADVTTVVDVDMTGVAAARERTAASYTAHVVRAAARALRDFPILNASLVEDAILVKRDVHVGVAVALQRGLVVPVVRFADRKGVEEISREIDALAARAEAGHLGPEELSGSTFTVTNSGAFGSLLFTPIINQPEVAILGMGKAAETPVVREGAIVVRRVMYLCLTYDHRVVDGAPAVQFLQAVKRRLEEGEGA